LKVSDRGKWGALLDETRRAVDVLSEKMVSDAVRELRERPR